MQLITDLRYVLRLLRKTPGFTSITLIVIVLGLALFIASFSFGKHLANEPMPYPDGDRYVTLRLIDAVSNLSLSYQSQDMYSYNRLSESLESYSTFGAYSDGNFVLSDGEYAQNYRGTSITPNLFLALATNPAIGRNFNLEDGELGSPNVAMISEKIWRDYYGSNPGVLGRSSLIDGEFYSIIGVMPEGFHFPRTADIWLPLAVSRSVQPAQELPLSLVGVLGQGANYSSAAIEYNEALTQLAMEFPDNYSNRIGEISDYSYNYNGALFSLSGMLNAITLIILAIAVVNLSSLLFIRSSSRQQELAVRSSVGATRWQLSKQVLLESFVICLAGLVLSFFVATFWLKLLEAGISSRGLEINSWIEFSVGREGVLIGIFSMIVIWLSSCFLVCLKAYRSDPGALLNGSNKGVEGSSSNVATRVVVGFEILLSSFLLILCGTLIILILRLVNTDFGFDPKDTLVASVSLSHPDYDSNQRRLTYFDQLTTDISEISGVTAVSLTTALPQRSGRPGIFSTAEFESTDEAQENRQTSVWLSNNYFSAVGLQLLEGREFEGGDTAESSPIVVINEQLAKQLWPDESAIGKQIRSVIGEESINLTVVGVSPVILQRQGTLNPIPTLYRPLSQGSPPDMSLVVKHLPQVNVDDLGIQIRGLATNIDRNIPVVNINSLERQINVDLQAIDLIALIFALFSLTTLVLASIGIYSVISRVIELRTYEIGIRRALGSTSFSIIWRFIRQGLNFLLLGVAVGGGLACLIIVSTAVSFGLNDLVFLPIIAGLSTLAMLMVILTATYIPARKAVALEPGDALRYE